MGKNGVPFFGFASSVYPLALPPLSPCRGLHRLLNGKCPESFFFFFWKTNNESKLILQRLPHEFVLGQQLWSSCALLITVVSTWHLVVHRSELFLVFQRKIVWGYHQHHWAFLCRLPAGRIHWYLENIDFKECGYNFFVWIYYTTILIA